jgi:predicted RNA-binding protein YlqC (UPF0109 family)
MVMKLVESLVKKLVDKPDKVVVNEVRTDDKVIIQVLVASGDLGRVIGSEGKIFRALKAAVGVVTNYQRDLVIDSIKE